MPYKIICSQPKKGTERSLPYEIKEWDDVLAIRETLEFIFKPLGYEHRVEEVTPVPVKFERKGKKGKR